MPLHGLKGEGDEGVRNDGLGAATEKAQDISERSEQGVANKVGEHET